MRRHKQNQLLNFQDFTAGDPIAALSARDEAFENRVVRVHVHIGRFIGHAHSHRDADTPKATPIVCWNVIRSTIDVDIS